LLEVCDVWFEIVEKREKEQKEDLVVKKLMKKLMILNEYDHESEVLFFDVYVGFVSRNIRDIEEVPFFYDVVLSDCFVGILRSGWIL
jgi:hypothetical protein